MTNRRSASVERFAPTARDVEVACLLYAHRVLTRDHLIRLGLFGSVPRCNARMLRLVEAGWAKRYRHALRGAGAQGLYGLAPSAVEAVANRLGADANDVSRWARRSVAPLFLEHTLRLADLRIVFEQESGLVKWLPEALCRHEYSVKRPGGSWRKRIFQPDACAMLDGGRILFVELDLGNVSLPSFARKVRSYREYLLEGAFQGAYGREDFEVLVLATTARRIQSLGLVARDEGGAVPFRLRLLEGAGQAARELVSGGRP